MRAAVDDYRWLLSEQAAPFVDRAASEPASLVSITKSLRKELSAERAHLILEQTELRRRARKKFSAAGRMFFTRELLEQATGEPIAAYKAGRFPSNEPLGDFCCGIGGDLLALAGKGPTTAVDRDAVACLLAAYNCRACGLSHAGIHTTDAAEINVEDFAAWHIDPDRRPAGKRTTRPDCFEPPRGAIDQLVRRQPNAAVKIAPASKTPERWAHKAETEFIGHQGECKQQVAWFGLLARQPGMRVATVLGNSGQVHQVAGSGRAELAVAPTIGRYVYEPHAAVLAASLTADVARANGLCAVSELAWFLTGDELIADGTLAGFLVTEVLPFDMKRLRQAIRHRQIGRLEVKQRGVVADPRELARRLNSQGDNAATLILFRTQRRVMAILGKRVRG